MEEEETPGEETEEAKDPEVKPRQSTEEVPPAGDDDKQGEPQEPPEVKGEGQPAVTEGEPPAEAEASAVQEGAEAVEGESEMPPAEEGVGPPEGEEPAGAEGNVAIDFIILPEGYGQTKYYPVERTLIEIRGELEAELSLPEGTLFLMNMSGAVAADGLLDLSRSLGGYQLKAGDRVGIELRLNFYEEQPLPEYVMPDVLELQCQDSQGAVKLVRVHIEKASEAKPFIGGYRQKQTRVEYHDAFTQTPIDKKPQTIVKYHRETQTYEYRSCSIQPKREAGTQVRTVSVYVSTEHDKVLHPKAYFTAEELFERQCQKVLLLQRLARGMLARKRVRGMRKQRDDLIQFESEEAERLQREADLRHKREIGKRMHPRTYEDFETLYSELEAWRINETNRIKKSTFDQATKQEALRELLAKETKLLQTIDRLKIQAHDANRDAKVRRLLEAMANPKVWAQSDGEATIVHTPFSTRAKELMDLYNGLRLPLLTVDERLDVLLHVKWTVKEFDCNLTREIVDLIDREADMLNRGRRDSSLKGLRQRLANLFLQFARTPEFNPEAQRFTKVPGMNTTTKV
ncbi:unnamed protein product [Vitrella brassicaformis CCMP3155]|uniref:IQ motif and ubiquitin-like domain-containing protein n=2 Tax=Vitrella brassicaformis TaxID=1169539 RepID=A0A0G4GFA6_VITBC|nr:unnamed protein product [Vitrella brassicaformis CCMP3155]|eukprot:CEM27838.1 unnamed protein product [Vitrella brassicaformis CCMP3155]